ncbi:PAS domain-containing hybrid sensor histidine kinase/response regulator [Dankookia rubra]|uniref:histidine kinase n=2 Tax=Dankookia rubra TaxID=1442381 RepID=A0A4R5Q7S8_9PROT|nr:PAS domain-containing hybrid sensor histidine kinase/response regulator [Dankookia rubra]
MVRSTTEAATSEELQVALEELQVTAEALGDANAALVRRNESLDEAVAARTAELQAANATLRESETNLRALLEGIPQLVWRSAVGGHWTWASLQWIAHTGLSAAESQGLGWLEAVHPDDRAGAEEAWRRAGTTGLFEADYRVWRVADGVWRWFQTRGVPLGRGGARGEWIGTSTDIEDQIAARALLARAGEELEARIAERTAELQAAEATLRQAQKMEAVGQLTGGIAHDFNNMLQGVAGGVEMARRRVDAGRIDEAQRYFLVARDAVERAAGLTRRLLAFARQQHLEPKPVDTDRLVTGMSDLIRRTVGPGIALELRLRNGSGAVLCDPNELENVLLNLCINARDAMPDGGRLTLCTEDVDLAAADIPGGEAAPGRYVALMVADTGTGMPPEVLARVFDPFFTTKPMGQGTGLGLSQVWGFARQSSGLVQVESTPGRGTTFRLLLPFHTRSAIAAILPAEEPAPASQQARMSGTVLLVDDEDAVRGPAADRLRELGYAVLVAEDGPAALRILASVRPDLLVTDVGLPGGMNGRQVAEAARERLPGLPVLFVTGYIGSTVLPSGFEVIGKPFTLVDLARRVAAILKVQGRQPDRGPGA